MYNQADKPILEKPKPYDEGQEWMKTDEGVLKPVWSCGPILPTSLADLLDTGEHEQEEEEKEEGEDESLKSRSVTVQQLLLCIK